MTSSVTNSLRSYLLNLFKKDIDSDGVGYYIGISRSEPYTADDGINTTTVGSLDNQLNFRHNLHAVKILSNASFVVPTVVWTSGDIYEAYDNKKPFQTNFYVENSLREVFLCVQQGRRSNGSAEPAFDEPRAITANEDAKTFKTLDGYHWKYMFKHSNLAYGTFRTTSYMPVKRITNLDTTIPEEIEQIRLQDSAVGGEILNIAIDSGGTNYSSPTITITGNGFGAKFTADVVDERIVNVRCDSTGVGGFSHGVGYDYAKVSVTDPSGGVGAKLRAVISPKLGATYDPVETLKSRQLMIQTDFIGTENSAIIANDTEFYSVGIIKGLQKFGVDSDFTGSSAIALKKLRITSVLGDWFDDATFSNALQTVTAKIFHLDGFDLYYYQDDETGFGSFTIGEDIINEDGGTADVLAITNPTVDAYSGDILYINTLDTAITREATQTEDIRIVIQLG